MLRSLVLILACWYRAGTAQAAESKEGRLELVLNPSFELDSANATFRSNRVDATCRHREEVYAEVHQTEAQLARRTLSARLLPSLRVHWTFEDGDGANITDMSGKGNAHATLKVKEEAQSGEQVVPASWEPSSLAGGSWAVHFRSQTYLEGPSAASVGMSSSGARTIMAWIKLYDGVGNAGIVTYGRSSLSRAFSLRVEGERIALDLRGPRAFGSGDTAVPSNMWSRSTFMVDTWHQVVFTYDGGQTDVSMTAYFDGMQSNQGRPTGAPRTDVDEPIYVHHNFNDDVGTASYFVDEVALFDTALSAVDVGLLYNHGQGLDFHQEVADAGGSVTHLFCSDGDGWRFMLPSGFSGSQVAVVQNGNEHWNGLDSHAGVNYATLHGNSAFLAQTVHGLTPGRTYTLRFLAAAHRSSDGQHEDSLLVLLIDGVRTMEFSSLSTSQFDELSQTFAVRRSSAEIQLLNDSGDGVDFLLDDLQLEECLECPASVAFGATDFIETCSSASDLYITFLGDEEDRSWMAQTELLALNLRICVATSATLTFQGNLLVLQTRDGDAMGLCEPEYADKAYVNGEEWYVPSECDGPCAPSTYSFPADNFHVPASCARIDVESTTATGDSRDVDVVPPSRQNGWEGRLVITNSGLSRTVYEVDIALACGRSRRDVVVHGHPSVSSTGVTFHGAQDYFIVPSWDYAIDAVFTVSFWSKREDDCSQQSVPDAAQGLYAHTVQRLEENSNEPLIRIYERCHHNGDLAHLTWDSSSIGVELRDDFGSWAAFAYPLADVNDFDTITGVWLHTMVSVTATSVATFADGIRVPSQDYVFPDSALLNLASPDPSQLAQTIGTALSNFTLTGDLYIGAEPAPGDGQTVNPFAGTMAMLAVDTAAISEADAACYFRGGEAALSNLALTTSDRVHVSFTANAEIMYDSFAARTTGQVPVLSVTNHPLPLYNGRYTVCGIESEMPAYRNAEGVHLYRFDESLIPEGWAVILKTTGDRTFSYSSVHWHDTSTLLDPTSDPSAPGNAKYPAYNEQQFDAIKACVGTLDNCMPTHVFGRSFANAAELFDGYHRAEGVTIADFTRVFDVEDPRASKQCEPQLPGFNSNCNGGNSVRWGYCANIASENCQSTAGEDADGAIGFGVEGEDCCPTGAGWTNNWASIENTPNGGNDGQAQGWILVRKYAGDDDATSGLFDSTFNDCAGLTDPNGAILAFWSTSFDEVVDQHRCPSGITHSSEVNFVESQHQNTLSGLKLHTPAPAAGVDLVVDDLLGDRQQLAESQWCVAFSVDGSRWEPECNAFNSQVHVPPGIQYVVLSNLHLAAFHNVRIAVPVQWHFNDVIPTHSTRPNGGYVEGELIGEHSLYPQCPGCTRHPLANVVVTASTPLDLGGDSDLEDVLMSSRLARQQSSPAYTWRPGTSYNWVSGDGLNTQVFPPDSWTADEYAHRSGYVTVALPFPFSYFGVPVLAIVISANGFISFTESTEAPASMYLSDFSCPIPNPGSCSQAGTHGPMTIVHNIVSMLWADLDPTSGGTISYSSGMSLAAVSFEAVPFVGTDATSTFQAVVYPDGNIVINYAEIGDGSDEYGLRLAPVVGFEDSLGLRGEQIAATWDEMPPAETSFQISPLSNANGTQTELVLAVGGLSIGSTYRLQLLFYEQVCMSVFDVLADGDAIVQSFAPADIQGGVSASGTAAYITYDFTALSASMDVALVPIDNNACNEPSLSAFTVQQTHAASSLEDLARGLPSQPCLPASEGIVVCGHTRQTGATEGGHPGHAIDGDTNGQFSSGSCAQTQAQSLPSWWQLDLGHVVHIDHVALYRADCCQQQLNGAQVLASVTPDHNHGVVCGVLGASAQLPEDVDCGDVAAQFITIVSSRTRALTVCEIEVWGRRQDGLTDVSSQTPVVATGALTSPGDLDFDTSCSVAVNLAGAPGLGIAGTEFMDEAAAARVLVADQVCNFVAGQGVGGAEAHVGKARNADDCARLVRARHPRANGATFLRIGGFDCFAEFDMIGTDRGSEWETCLFDHADALRVESTEGDHFECQFAVGNGVSEYDQLVGVADSTDACVQMVMSMRPEANGATMPREGTGSCFAEFGMTSSDAEAQWTTCQFPRHTSCAEIYQEDPSSRTGAYTIVVTGQLLPVHCDMSDGGWTLVMKTAVGPEASHVGIARLAGPDGALNSTYSSSLPVGALVELCAAQIKALPARDEVVLHVQMVGAGGASGARGGWEFGADGGTGGSMVGEIRLPLPTGQPLRLLVVAGQRGEPFQTIWNLGGGGAVHATTSYNDNRYSGGGGGASGIWLLSSTVQEEVIGATHTAATYSAQFDPDSTLMMAGGGGGGGASKVGRGNRGGAGGYPEGADGGAPYDTQAPPSGGGTQTAGGSNNVGSSESTQTQQNDGIQFAGGQAGSTSSKGGGGGGGWYGGEGGRYEEPNTIGGGGGGSGYCHAQYCTVESSGSSLGARYGSGGLGDGRPGQDGFVQITVDGEVHQFETGQSHIWTYYPAVSLSEQASSSHNTQVWCRPSVAESSPGQWAVRRPGCVAQQHRIAVYPGQTVAQCKAKCVETARCAAVVYKPDTVEVSGTCRTGTSWRPRDCEMVRSTDPAGCDGSLEGLELHIRPQSATMGFTLGDGVGASVCATHSDCAVGFFCDSMRVCSSCESITSQSCSTVECQEGSGLQCVDCCDSSEMFVHCPASHSDELETYCALKAQAEGIRDLPQTGRDLEYVGCWVLSSTHPTLATETRHTLPGATASPLQCSNICDADYIALGHDGRCVCGGEPEWTEQQPAALCLQPCGGDSSYMCGGAPLLVGDAMLHISVYKILGCPRGFTDIQDERSCGVCLPGTYASVPSVVGGTPRELHEPIGGVSFGAGDALLLKDTGLRVDGEFAVQGWVKAFEYGIPLNGSLLTHTRHVFPDAAGTGQATGPGVTVETWNLGAQVGIWTPPLWVDNSCIQGLEDFEAYPDLPDTVTILESVFAIDVSAEYVGTRLQGTFHAPQDGSYTFWVNGDDQTELYFTDPYNGQVEDIIASVPGWAYPNVWDKYPEQRSRPQQLKAGRAYPLQVLTVNNQQQGNAAVGVTLPDGTVVRPMPVDPYMTVGYDTSSRSDGELVTIGACDDDTVAVDCEALPMCSDIEYVVYPNGGWCDSANQGHTVNTLDECWTECLSIFPELSGVDFWPSWLPPAHTQNCYCQPGCPQLSMRSMEQAGAMGMFLAVRKTVDAAGLGLHTPPPPQLPCLGYPQGFRYTYNQAHLSWLAAEAACVAHGGHLASMHSADDEAQIFQAAGYTGSIGFWIGLFTPDGGATWTWTDSTPTDYTNWGGPGQPADPPRNQYQHEDFVMVAGPAGPLDPEIGQAPRFELGKWADVGPTLENSWAHVPSVCGIPVDDIYGSAASDTPTWHRSTLDSMILQSDHHVGCYLADWEELIVQGHPDQKYNGQYAPAAQWGTDQSYHMAYHNRQTEAYMYSYDTAAAGYECHAQACFGCTGLSSCTEHSGCIWVGGQEGCRRGIDYTDDFAHSNWDEWQMTGVSETLNKTAAFGIENGQAVAGGRGAFCSGVVLERTFETDWPHTEISIELDFFVYGSWERGEAGRVAVDDDYIWRQMFEGQAKDAPPTQTHVSYRGPHSAAQLRLKVTTSLNQACDAEGDNPESWAFGGVEIKIVDQSKWLFWSFDDRNQTGSYRMQDREWQRGGHLSEPLLSSDGGLQAYDATRWDTPTFGTHQLRLRESSNYTVSVSKADGGGAWQSESFPTIVTSLGACAEQCRDSTYFGVTDWEPPSEDGLLCGNDSNEHCNACLDEESCLVTAGCGWWAAQSPGAKCWRDLPCETRGRPCLQDGWRMDSHCCVITNGDEYSCDTRLTCTEGLVSLGRFHDIRELFEGFGWCDCGNTCCAKEENVGTRPRQRQPSRNSPMECRCGDSLPHTATPDVDSCTGDSSISIFTQPLAPEWHNVVMTVSSEAVHHYVDSTLVGTTANNLPAAAEDATCTSESVDIAAIGNSVSGGQHWGSLAQLQLSVGGFVTANYSTAIVYPIDFSNVYSLLTIDATDGRVVVGGSQMSESDASCSACSPGMYDTDSSALTPCDPCPSGQYSDGYGSVQCTQCPSGTETDYASVTNGDFEHESTGDDFLIPSGWQGTVDPARYWGALLIRSPANGLNTAWGNELRDARAAPSGAQYLAIAGSKAYIEQNVTAITPWARYQLSFAIAKPLMAEAGVKVEVYVNGRTVWGPAAIRNDGFESVAVSFESSSTYAVIRFENKAPFQSGRESLRGPPYGLSFFIDAISVRRSDVCRECAAGRYDHDTDATTECVQCPVGMHSALAGVSACATCPTGSTASLGATSRWQCESCSAGKFERIVEGARLCVSCSAGTYRGAQDAAAECTQCSVGQTTRHDGAGRAEADCSPTGCSDSLATNYEQTSTADIEFCEYNGGALAQHFHVYCQHAEAPPTVAITFGRNGLNAPTDVDCPLLYDEAGVCRSLAGAGWTLDRIDAFDDCYSDGLSGACDGGRCETCLNGATGTYAGFGCAGDCSSAMTLGTLPQGYNQAELTMAMHHDNAACKITVSVGGNVIYSQFHSSDAFTLPFSYASDDSLSIYQDGSVVGSVCMVHLYQLRVLNSEREDTSCVYTYDRGTGSWPDLPQGLASGMPHPESGDESGAWLLSYTPSHDLLAEPRNSFVVQGHTSKNGTEYTATPDRLHVRSVVRAVLRYISVKENTHAQSGGGLYIFDADVLVTNAEFIDNQATLRGGAIYASCRWRCEYQRLELAHVVFSGNAAADGGAIWVESTRLVGVGLEMRSSHATNRGGSVFAIGSSVIQLTNVSFTANVAQVGAGVYAKVHTGQVEPEVPSGSAVWMNVSIVGSQFQANQLTSDQDGVALYLYEPTALKLKELSFAIYDDIKSVKLDGSNRPGLGDCQENPCEQGYYCRYVQYSLSCHRCDNGQIPNAERSGCEKCEAGTEPNVQGSSCVACPPGEVAAAGEKCHRCPADKVMKADQTGCFVCPNTQIAAHGECRCAPGYYDATNYMLQCSGNCDGATDRTDFELEVAHNYHQDDVPLLHSCVRCPKSDAGDACVRCVVGPDGISSIPMIEPGWGRADFGESKEKFEYGEVTGPAQSLYERMQQPTAQCSDWHEGCQTEIHIFQCLLDEMCLGEWFTVDRSVVASAEALAETNDDPRASVTDAIPQIPPTGKRNLMAAAIGTHYGGSPKERADRFTTFVTRLESHEEADLLDAEADLRNYYGADNAEMSTPPVTDDIYETHKDRAVVTDDMLITLSTYGRENSRNINILNQSRVEYICRDGHNADGALCAACLSATNAEMKARLNFVGGTTKLCRTCEGKAVSGNITELLAIMAALAFTLVYLPVKIGQIARARRKQEAEAALGDGYVLVGSEGDEKASPQVSHFQVIMQFPVIMSIKFPKAFDEVLDMLRLLKGDIMGYLDIKCAVPMDMYIEFALAMLLVPVFCGGLVVTHQTQSSKQCRQLHSRWRRRKAKPESESALGEHLDIGGETCVNADDGDAGGADIADDSLLGDMFLNRTFMFLFGVYPFLVSRVIHMLACADYTIGPESVLSWQRYDYSINCDSTKYTKVRYAAGLMLVLYPIGIPVFALWIFRKNRKRLLDRSHHRHSIEDDEATSPDEDRPAPAKPSIWTFFGAGALKAKKPWWHGNRDTFYFMVRDYKPQYYYFEIVEFSRKLCLSGVLMIAEAGSTTQILLGVLLSFMFTTVYIVVRPYADTNTNTFRMLVDAALFFTLQCILGIHSGFVGDCEWLSVEKVGLILIFLNVVMVALSCGLEAIARAFKIVRETQLVGIMYRPGDTVEMRSTADGPSAATSKVYHGVFKSHAKAESRPCVVKVRSLSLAVLNVEEAIMMECRHPNVVKMFQAMDDGYSHFLAMMPCECSIQMAVENGSLFSAAGQVAMDRVLNISKAVIAGVNGLHEADFVHCNIHPSNVLLSLDGVPMLSGFSTATTLNIDAFATTVNTQHTFEGYRAPEVIAGRDTSIIVELKIPQAIDTYSLGCTLFYICSNGEHAFPTDMGIDQQAAAANRIGNAQLAAEAQSVLSGMLDPNPYARPALGQVLAHPWFWTAERKVQYLGEVGNMLPVREHKSKNAFIADLEAAADEQLGEYNELEPDQGGSWARLLNPRYPLGNDGWGKQQRRPEDEERMYHVYGLPKPSKRQKQEREGLIAACKPLGTHEAKHIRMVGLLKMIRNFDAHGAQHIQAGRFESEAALHNYLIEPFPWLLMAVYCCDAKHQLTITATDQTMESERTLGLGPNETMANPMAATGGGDDLHFSSGSIMSGMTIGGGDTDDASSVASSQTTSTSGGSFAF